MQIHVNQGISPRRRTLGIVAGAVILLVIVLSVLATLFTEVLWFKEVHFTAVFWTVLRTRLALGFIFGLIFATLMLINLWIVRKITNPARLFSVPDQIFERYRATLQPYMKWAVIGGSLLFGLFAGTSAATKWRDYQLFTHSVTVGTTDPIFGKDLGFFLFRLPFQQFISTWMFSTLILVTLAVGFSHYFMGGIRPQQRGDRVAPEVRAHLSVLLGLIVLLKAWGYRLDQFNLLYSQRGVVQGASYTDTHAQLPALRLLVVIAVVCAVLFLINARFKNWILPIGGIGLLAVTSVIGGGVYPAAIQKFRVKPNERALERPYIKRNIEATRKAFKLSDVQIKADAATGTLKASDISSNPSTVQNIRLWDPRVLRDSYVNQQRIKQYYDFVDVDVDRYKFNDGLRQVMISAREIAPSDLSSDAKTWLNTHLFYTHGYSVVASRVDRVTGQGAPDFVLQNIPPVATQGGPTVDVPQIYFGEKEDVPFVLVKSDQPELDYPLGTEGEASYKTTSYTGKGGIQLKSFLRRSAFAWRFRDVNLLISGAINKDSRIMFRRSIADRVARIAPFVRIDDDPYITIAGGRLVWIVDGYTTSSMYPYSQRISFVNTGNVMGSGNYMRNSVKFTVDAFNGTITGYQWDTEDPVLKAWMKVFPGIFKPAESMPEAVRKHVRYPEGMFRIQTDRYANYHVTNPDAFYQKEDAWLVGRDPTWCLNQKPNPCVGNQVLAPGIPPYYVLMKLPGDTEARFVLVRPFIPGGASRQNLVGYMVAHSDPGEYGKIITYRFPRAEQIAGPEQVQAQINQDPIVSQQITLWNDQNSRVIYGNLLIVPLEKAVLYVQPLYLQGEGSAIPQLKRVVAVANGNVEMATTLEDALRQLLGQSSGDSGVPGLPDATVADAIQEALTHDQAAQECLKRADFACYGREQAATRAALERAALKSGAQPSPSPKPS